MCDNILNLSSCKCYKILAFNLIYFCFWLVIIFSLNVFTYIFFFATRIIIRIHSQPCGFMSFLPSSHQAKSYYLTIDRAPSIQLFGTGNTSSYQNTSVQGDLFSHQRPPDLGKLDFFRIYHPSPTRGRVL